MSQNNQEILSYLFALRVSLQDDYEDEIDIIKELKKYLLENNYNNMEINQTLYNFYNSYGINISMDIIQNIVLTPNNSLFNFNNLLPISYSSFINVINNLTNIVNNENNTFDNFEDVIVSLSTEELNNIKSNKLEKDLLDNCSICLENMKNGETISELKCSHNFHSDCIKHYLDNYNHKCPICRIELGKVKYSNL